MRMEFAGAAQEVTGSCILVEAGGARFLVDCGLFQGGRDSRARNMTAWKFDPAQIDFVLLTHAHVDHCGLLPRLSAQGFKGPVYTTTATADLLPVMLLDSAFIQEAEWMRERGKTRRHQRRAPARSGPAPLYTVAQARDCLEQVRGVTYDVDVRPHPDVRCRFRDAGHILGSAIIEVWVTEEGKTTKIVFSGDLGQPGRPIVRDPVQIESADVLVIESTYGNRQHRSHEDTIDELVSVVQGVMQRRRGNIIIPAFALGRTQEILWLLADLCRQGRLPHLRVIVDSPMAARATDITWKHTAFLDDETRELLSMRRAFPNWLDLRFTRSVQESMELNRIRSGAIIISASGMCDAGRIKHHLANNVGRSESAIVIVGYQAEGTLGRKLVDGEKRVRIFGEEHRVRARVHTIGGLSAHADRAALLGWVDGFARPPAQTFVVHGEAATALGFAQVLSARPGWHAVAPAAGTVVEL